MAMFSLARVTQTAGLNMNEGVVGDMKAFGVREAYKSKLQVRITHRPVHGRRHTIFYLQLKLGVRREFDSIDFQLPQVASCRHPARWRLLF